MQSFVDEAVIEVASGKGGAGSVHFRREKYVPKGGPDGGDGGDGGDVVFVVKENVKTLSHIRYKKHFFAKNGESGAGKRKHGRDGENVEIEVPPGTIVKDFAGGELIKDLNQDGERWTYLCGGKGGKGNSHFATSTNQTPRYAQPGLPGISATIRLELRIIADVGFVGFPNAGKSTLLKTLSNAEPKIGAYPFTTKIPNLGVLQGGYRDVLIADIPGLLEGASHGVGLGLQFLKHITRTSGLAFVIDCSDDTFLEQLPVLKKECEEYDPALLRKKRIVIGTKLDLDGAEKNFEELNRRNREETLIGVSAYAFRGIRELKEGLLQLAGSGEE